ncbi:MAG: hypothetical protein PHO15_10530 [Eubacteriales bacterium]|nr:hypothetical protein [Eubacteriales bacterium]
MQDGYARESQRLDAMAGTLAVVAKEFEKTKDVETAVAGYVLCGLILRQLEALDKQLDLIIEKTGI